MAEKHHFILLRMLSWNLLNSALSAVVPLLTIPLLVTIFDMQVVGQVAIIQAAGLFAALYIDYGMNPILIKRATRKKTTIFNSYQSIKLVKVVFLSLIFLPFALLFNIPFWQQLLFMSVLLTGLIPVWYFYGQGKNHKAIIYATGPKVATLMALYVVQDTVTVDIFGIISIVSVLLSLCALLVREKFLFTIPSFGKLIRREIRYFKLFSALLATNAYTSMIPLVLSLNFNSEAIGRYSIFEKIKNAFIALFYPINNTLYQVICRRNAVWLRRLIVLGAVFFGGAVAAIMLFASPLISNVFVSLDDVRHLSHIVDIGASLPFLVMISSALGLNCILLNGYIEFYSRSLIGVSVVGVGLLTLVSSSQSLDLVIFALILIEFIVCVLYALKVWRNRLL